MKPTIESTRAALAALDFSAENQAASHLLAEIKRIDEAHQRANARLGEIGRLLNSDELEQEVGRDVAKALLDGADPAVAAQESGTREALLSERASLSAALGSLRKRENDLNRELSEVRQSARERLAQPLRQVIAEIEQSARAAAELIGDAYAMLAAIAATTKQGGAEAGVVGQGFAALIGAGVVPYRARVDVAPEIRAMLSPLADIGEALPCGVPEWAGVPDDVRMGTLAAMVEARRAVG